MEIPEPVAGMVIRYSFLWHSEFRSGRDEASKDRPAAIVAAMKSDSDGAKRVVVLPVTHTPPSDASLAIEIPANVKKRLGLDGDRSWIVLTDADEFEWPGPDIRPVRPDPGASITYGFLPPKLFAELQRAFAAAIQARRVRRVPRTE